MWPYWLMFLPALVGVLAKSRLPRHEAFWMMVLVGAGYALTMGLRDHVGGDWGQYADLFDTVSGMSFNDAISSFGDPGYYGLGWVVARLGGDIYVLNLICAAILAIGTVTFARRQPLPWLALLVAVPYLLIVVGMGYTRQSAAIGCCVLGFVALGRGKIVWFVVWILIAATFHKTATILLPIGALAETRNRVWTGLWVGVMTVGGTWLFLSDDSDTLWKNYVVSSYADESQGAGIRVFMCVLPALLLLWLRSRIVPDPVERKLWLWIAALTLICLPLLWLSPTAVDRMALYFIPIQLFVFSRLPFAVRSIDTRQLVQYGIIGYSASVQFVWLNYAANAEYWVPYHFVPLWN